MKNERVQLLLTLEELEALKILTAKPETPEDVKANKMDAQYNSLRKKVDEADQLWSMFKPDFQPRRQGID